MRGFDRVAVEAGNNKQQSIDQILTAHHPPIYSLTNSLHSCVIYPHIHMATTSRKQKLPPPPPRTVQTQSRNKESHPGKPDLPQARRPSSLVQAEKAAKAKDQAIREANENNRMQAVADIENSQDKEDAEADYHANHLSPANLPPWTQRSVAKLSSTNISSTIEGTLIVTILTHLFLTSEKNACRLNQKILVTMSMNLRVVTKK